MSNEEWNTYFAGHWNFAGAKQDKHLAMFPDELPRRLIKMFSFIGETVLDPFAGSGTTAKMARELGRNSISYEINNEFIPIINNKIGGNDLYTIVEFENTSVVLHDEIEIKINDLPYKFTDVHKLDKKIDIKRTQYGSKFDKNSSGKRQELFSVRRVISPELVELNNGTVIRLIGIKQDNTKLKGAVNFMIEKFNGRKVFVKGDNVKYNDDYFPVYLYLDNKTFINAHLIKKGLAFVDVSVPFIYKDKFISLRNNLGG